MNVSGKARAQIQIFDLMVMPPSPGDGPSVSAERPSLRPLFGNDAAAKHIHAANVVQRVRDDPRRDLDAHRLIEWKRVALAEPGNDDFLRARLVGLPGHHERERLPARNLRTSRLEPTIGDRELDLSRPGRRFLRSATAGRQGENSQYKRDQNRFHDDASES